MATMGVKTKAPATAKAAGKALGPVKSPATPTRLQDYPPHDRDNANKVSGQALLELGRRHGLPMSSMTTMTEDKLRRQIMLAQTNAMHAEPQ